MKIFLKVPGTRLTFFWKYVILYWLEGDRPWNMQGMQNLQGLKTEPSAKNAELQQIVLAREMWAFFFFFSGNWKEKIKFHDDKTFVKTDRGNAEVGNRFKFDRFRRRNSSEALMDQPVTLLGVFSVICRDKWPGIAPVLRDFTFCRFDPSLPQ